MNPHIEITADKKQSLMRQGRGRRRQERETERNRYQSTARHISVKADKYKDCLPRRIIRCLNVIKPEDSGKISSKFKEEKIIKVIKLDLQLPEIGKK